MAPSLDAVLVLTLDAVPPRLLVLASALGWCAPSADLSLREAEELLRRRVVACASGDRACTSHEHPSGERSTVLGRARLVVGVGQAGARSAVHQRGVEGPGSEVTKELPVLDVHGATGRRQGPALMGWLRRATGWRLDSGRVRRRTGRRRSSAVLA